MSNASTTSGEFVLITGNASMVRPNPQTKESRLKGIAAAKKIIEKNRKLLEKFDEGNKKK